MGTQITDPNLVKNNILFVHGLASYADFDELNLVAAASESPECGKCKKQKVAPDGGLEPPTTRLRVVRSTD